MEQSEVENDAEKQRVEIVFDGLLDPRHGGQLSSLWAQSGIFNQLDISGQSAILEVPIDDEPQSETEASDQEQASHESIEHHEGMPASLVEALNVARAFGLEVRDRVGKRFQIRTDKTQLHEHVAREYRQSLAQWFSFGLPAVILHLLAPWLSRGGGSEASSMAFPWLIEMLLCGWLMRVAIWPVVWQGILSLVHFRMTSDLYACLVLGLLFFPSSWGVLSLLWQDEPWFVAAITSGSPPFHLAVIYTGLLAYQRWGMHRFAGNLSGLANHMLPIMHHVMFVSILVAGIMYWFRGYEGMMAVLLLVPAMMAIAMNPWYPSSSLLFSVISFGLLIMMGQKMLAGFNVQIAGNEMNAAMSFHAVLAFSFVAGWKRMGRDNATHLE